ncbi:MAG: cation:proton antiporter [Planctomycetota bacterium]
MSDRMALFVLLGLALLGTVPLKRFADRVPIIYVAAGWIAFSLPLGLPTLTPATVPDQGQATEYLTEFAVIVSLLAAGLAIDRPFSLRTTSGGTKQNNWLRVWPLIVLTMPLTIAALTLLGAWWLGLGLGSALLLGAVLSPTDPVLARSVQVGPPGENQDAPDDVRFSLTAEAGINDGLAFPFTYLAMAFAAASGSQSSAGIIAEWLAVDVLWRCLAGVGVGLLVGWLTSKIAFRDADHSPASYTLGVVIFGTLFAAYGLAEIIGGYGFLAVFVGAVTVRQTEPDAGHPHVAHRFVDQVEQIVLVMLLLGVGGMIASGALEELTPAAAALGLLAVFVIRPFFGWIALADPLAKKHGGRLPPLGRFIVAFAGIRGLGTLYYLAYATNQTEFDHADLVWAICVFTILVSVVTHGLAVPPLVRAAEHRGAMAAPRST